MKPFIQFLIILYFLSTKTTLAQEAAINNIADSIYKLDEIQINAFKTMNGI